MNTSLYLPGTFAVFLFQNCFLLPSLDIFYFSLYKRTSTLPPLQTTNILSNLCTLDIYTLAIFSLFVNSESRHAGAALRGESSELIGSTEEVRCKMTNQSAGAVQSEVSTRLLSAETFGQISASVTVELSLVIINK